MTDSSQDDIDLSDHEDSDDVCSDCGALKLGDICDDCGAI
jgi:hypothetical protein